MSAGIIVLIVCIVVVVCGLYSHRRVIRAIMNKEEMPKAPAWHFWVSKDKRRS